jgi:hypothetical protein
MKPKRRSPNGTSSYGDPHHTASRARSIAGLADGAMSVQGIEHGDAVGTIHDRLAVEGGRRSAVKIDRTRRPLRCGQIRWGSGQIAARKVGS